MPWGNAKWWWMMYEEPSYFYSFCRVISLLIFCLAQCYRFVNDFKKRGELTLTSRDLGYLM